MLTLTRDRGNIASLRLSLPCGRTRRYRSGVALNVTRRDADLDENPCVPNTIWSRQSRNRKTGSGALAPIVLTAPTSTTL